MIKILHTADWHLGKKLERFQRLPEQQEVLEEICRIAEHESVDMVVIAGDIYDSFNPPTEAEKLFYRTVKRLADNGRRPVVIIAGNHDSPDRIQAPDPLALENGILMAGYPDALFSPTELENGFSIVRAEPGFVEIQLPEKDKEPVRIILAPYAAEARLKQFLGWDDPVVELRKVLADKWATIADNYCDPTGVNILVGHFFMLNTGEAEPQEPEGERTILHVGGAPLLLASDLPSQVQYTALGHLHGLRKVVDDDRPVLYSGSPLGYSMSEAGQQKQVVIAELSANGGSTWKSVPLTAGRQLHRCTFDTVSDALNWLEANPGTLVELTLHTENYISGSDRKALLQVHDGVIAIIPEFAGQNENQQKQLSRSDLDRSLPELFTTFFKAENDGQEPDEQLMELLREICGDNSL